MKETINISISGISFVIDKEAYAKLHDYVEVVKGRFSNQGTEGEEIVADIEARIAEIFLSKRQSALEPITVECVEEVISQMGMPEVVETPLQEEYDYEQEAEKREVLPKVKRRLYRNKEGATLGGVLNGLASYFGIDVVWLRISIALLFVIFMFTEGAVIGYMVITYLILWIIIPQAKTALQKLEMDGKNASILNIETAYKNNDPSTKYRKEIGRSLGFLGAILKGILVVVVGILLLLMFLVVASGVLALVGVFAAREFFEPLVLWNLPLAAICAFLAIVIPCVVLATIFIATLRSKVNIPRAFYVISAVLWFAAILGGGTMWLRNLYESNTKRSVSKTIYESNELSKLYVKYMPDSMVVADFDAKTLRPFKNTMVDAVKNGVADEVLGIYCHETYDSTFKVVATFSAKGADDDKAIEHAKQIVLPYKIVGDTIFILPVFGVEDGKYYQQKVSVDFYVPQGKEVIASDYDKIKFYDGTENGEYSIFKALNGAEEFQPGEDADEEEAERRPVTIEASATIDFGDNEEEQKKGKDSVGVERKTIQIEVKK